LWSWQETVKALFSGKVTVVDVYPGITIRAVNMDVPLPSVIALTEYVPQPNQKPAFTRRNVFLRDGYKCQYCAKMYRTHDLSLDHVLPKCVGGRLEW
jgi:5-methylcytosine-specific restriction endonuclease McrA